MADDISTPTDHADAHRGAGYVIKELIRVVVGLVFVALIIAGGYWLVGPNTGQPPATTAATTSAQPPAGPAKEAAAADTGNAADQTQAAAAPTAPPQAPAPSSQPVPPPAPAPSPQPAQTQAAAPPPPPPASAETTTPPAPPPVVAAEPPPPAVAPEPAPAPASPPPAPASSASAGKPSLPAVQFASEPTEVAARHEWQRLQKRVPGLLGNREPEISRFEHAGHVFWRLRTSGFDDAAQAREFCLHAHAKGLACTVIAAE